MYKILVISGQGAFALDRGQTTSGSGKSYADFLVYMTKAAFDSGVTVDFFQADHEGETAWKIEFASGVYDGIIINPAFFAQTGMMICDAIRASKVPCVEVRVPDVSLTESYCEQSLMARDCIQSVKGRGLARYSQALELLKAHLQKNQAQRQ